MKKNFVYFLIVSFLVFLSLIYLFASSVDYKVYITQKSGNYYKIEQTNLWIKTSYCYEYAYYREVTLRTYGYGLVKGRIFFDNGRQCQVDEFYKEVPVNYKTLGITMDGRIVQIDFLLVPTTTY